MMGLEPITPGLEVQCAIHCATWAYIKQHYTLHDNYIIVFSLYSFNCNIQYYMYIIYLWLIPVIFV
jgi:hypothetical protein